MPTISNSLVPAAGFSTASGAAFYAARDIAGHVGDERVTALFHRVPSSLSDDAPTLRRIANLIGPVNASGTRGSYAGWIARSAIEACAARADAANFASLVVFFQRGGSIRELESIAARILPPVPGPNHSSESSSLITQLISKISPLRGWRDHRRATLFVSGDPLSALKLNELEDRNLHLSAGETSPATGRRQKTAYLEDADVAALVKIIEADAAVSWDERDAKRRYGQARDKIGSVLLDPKKPYDRLWAPQFKAALELLGDSLSVAVAGRIQKQYALRPLPQGKFEEGVRKRHALEGVQRFGDPKNQRAVYFKESARRGAEVFLQSHPSDLPWNMTAADVFYEVLATSVHEDDHHVRLRARKYSGGREDKFALELHGHGVEYLWRAHLGDTALLRSLTTENPLGFALAFRDYFEANY